MRSALSSAVRLPGYRNRAADFRKRTSSCWSAPPAVNEGKLAKEASRPRRPLTSGVIGIGSKATNAPCTGGTAPTSVVYGKARARWAWCFAAAGHGVHLDPLEAARWFMKIKELPQASSLRWFSEAWVPVRCADRLGKKRGIVGNSGKRAHLRNIAAAAGVCRGQLRSDGRAVQ